MLNFLATATMALGSAIIMVALFVLIVDLALAENYFAASLVTGIALVMASLLMQLHTPRK